MDVGSSLCSTRRRWQGAYFHSPQPRSMIAIRSPPGRIDDPYNTTSISWPNFIRRQTATVRNRSHVWVPATGFWAIPLHRRGASRVRPFSPSEGAVGKSPEGESARSLPSYQQVPGRPRFHIAVASSPTGRRWPRDCPEHFHHFRYTLGHTHSGLRSFVDEPPRRCDHAPTTPGTSPTPTVRGERRPWLAG